MNNFLNNSNKVAKEVKRIIDAYWRAEITYGDAREQLLEIMDDPECRVRIKRGEKYTGVFNNIMGKKRIEEFEELIK